MRENALEHSRRSIHCAKSLLSCGRMERCGCSVLRCFAKKRIPFSKSVVGPVCTIAQLMCCTEAQQSYYCHRTWYEIMSYAGDIRIMLSLIEVKLTFRLANLTHRCLRKSSEKKPWQWEWFLVIYSYFLGLSKLQICFFNDANVLNFMMVGVQVATVEKCKTFDCRWTSFVILTNDIKCAEIIVDGTKKI